MKKIGYENVEITKNLKISKKNWKLIKIEFENVEKRIQNVK